MRIKHRLVLESCTFLMVCAVGLLLAGPLHAQAGGVVAHDAWVRVPAPSKTETALYMVLENHTSQPRAVVSVSSESADKVEMHEMKTVKQGDSMNNNAGSMNDSNSSMGKSDSSSDQSSMSMGKPADQSMMAMMPIKKIEIPANGKTTLAPNGLHLMMFGLKTRPAPGDKIKVTLKLDDGTTIPVEATVR